MDGYKKQIIRHVLDCRNKMKTMLCELLANESWQDAAKIDKVIGIIKYHDRYPKMSISECKMAVENYLMEN